MKYSINFILYKNNQIKSRFSIWLIFIILLPTIPCFGQNSETMTYEYDKLNRVTKVTYTSSAASIIYTYDPAGNRTSTQIQGSNLKPSAMSVSPSSANAGSVNVTIDVAGTNLVNGSVVQWNGNNRQTVYYGSFVRAFLSNADLASPGSASVRVVNPEPSSGASNELIFTINQAECSYSISPNQVDVPASASTGSFTAITQTGCPTTAVANDDWLTITSVIQGTVNYSVAANNGAARAGAITVGGQTFTVLQNSSFSCSYTPISYGETLTGSYSSSDCTYFGNYNDVYNFNGTEGDQISISSSFPSVNLQLQNNGVITPTSSINGTQSYTLPRTGVYTLFTSPSLKFNQPGGSGSYTLTLTKVGVPQGLQYYPLQYPIRLLDTRSGKVAGVDACYAPGQGFVGFEQIKTQPAQVTCQGLTIPSSAQAIVGTATARNTSSPGNLRLYPAGEELPLVSNVNFIPGRTVSNSFTVKLGTGGAFNIYSFSSSDVTIEVTGYYAAPSATGLYYHQLPNPIRILETRPGEAGFDTPGAPLSANVPRSQPAHLTYLGITIPASAKAVTGNATVVNTTGAATTGTIKLYPAESSIPDSILTENINYIAGQVIPNAFTVRLDNTGRFKINSSAQTHFLIDITGYYSTEPAADQNGSIGLLFNILPKPFRLLDTRQGESACDAPQEMLFAGEAGIRVQTVRGRTCSGQTVPSTARAIFGNGTFVHQNLGVDLTTQGNIRLYPGEQPLANASNLNFESGKAIPNSFIVGLGANNGAINIFSFNRTHFIIDVSGYFAAP